MLCPEGGRTGGLVRGVEGPGACVPEEIFGESLTVLLRHPLHQLALRLPPPAPWCPSRPPSRWLVGTP